MERVFLVGNDINNLTSTVSWNRVLDEIKLYCNYDQPIDYEKVPFPMLYEQIFLRSRTFNYDGDTLNELDLKRFIGNIVDTRKFNDIHKALVQLGVKNIITTNYDYNLESAIEGTTTSTANSGFISERRYSVFRHTSNAGVNIWHIHGESERPESINLGFEHYGGQLQHIRNYITGNVEYAKELPYRFDFKSLDSQGESNRISWVDLFYTSEIHILGLGLDFQEYDLWWLFSSRARMFDRFGMKPNPIYYYTPRKYFNQQKNDLMSSLKITTKVYDLVGMDFYRKVVDELALRRDE